MSWRLIPDARQASTSDSRWVSDRMASSAGWRPAGENGREEDVKRLGGKVGLPLAQVDQRGDQLVDAISAGDPPADTELQRVGEPRIVPRTGDDQDAEIRCLVTHSGEVLDSNAVAQPDRDDVAAADKAPGERVPDSPRCPDEVDGILMGEHERNGVEKALASVHHDDAGCMFHAPDPAAGFAATDPTPEGPRRTSNG